MSMLDGPKRPKLMVYCDESCTVHRYLTIGATMYSRDHLPGISEALKPCLDQFSSEIKWSKITNNAEAKYASLIDRFFELNKGRSLHYHCMFADTQKFNHAAFKATDEDTFYKLYYNLLTYRVAPHWRQYDFHIFMDERQTKYSLDDLKRILNKGAAKVHGCATNPFKSIEPVDSKKSKILQVQDVILGGMAIRRNGAHTDPNLRIAKRNLSQRIFEKTGVVTYDLDTAKRTIFSIWNFSLK